VSFCSEKRPFFPGRREDHKTFNIEIGGGVGGINNIKTKRDIKIICELLSLTRR